ncbi:MAG: hypothetical protein ACK5VT_06710 [Alphaproteobacteria bacterium]
MRRPLPRAERAAERPRCGASGLAALAFGRMRCAGAASRDAKLRSAAPRPVLRQLGQPLAASVGRAHGRAPDRGLASGLHPTRPPEAFCVAARALVASAPWIHATAFVRFGEALTRSPHRHPISGGHFRPAW